MDIHWSTPNCPGSVCYDTLLRSDGTYQKQRIVVNGTSTTLFCEHGTWAARGCFLDFNNACTSSSLTQPWSSSATTFTLSGVVYTPEPGGIFNCSANEC